MPFPRKFLNEGEEIVLDLRPHWWVLVSPIAATAVVFTALLLFRSINEMLALALLLVTGICLIWLFSTAMRRNTTEFVVTSDRIIYRSGILAKNGMEIPLERINNILFNQSIFERMLHIGDLVIESAGREGQQPFTDVPNPSVVQNEIYQQMEKSQARDHARMGGGQRELSIPEQIEKLDELRQEGVISQAEFDQKKTQLLDRM